MKCYFVKYLFFLQFFWCGEDFSLVPGLRRGTLIDSRLCLDTSEFNYQPLSFPGIFSSRMFHFKYVLKCAEAEPWRDGGSKAEPWNQDKSA